MGKPVDTTTEQTVFEGTLIKRYYKPGQQYMQLVFKSAKATKLSISRDVKLVRSLQVGRTYRIVGQEYELGSKRYIHEPVATPLAYSSGKSLGLRIGIFGGIALVAIVGGVLFMNLHSRSSQVQVASAAQHTTVVSETPVINTTTTKQPVVNTPAATTTPTPTSSPTPKTAVPKNNITTPQVPVVPPVTPPTPPQNTVPVCDDPVPIPFDTRPSTGPDDPAAAGVDGYDQTCYPDGKDNPATATTKHVAPVTEIDPIAP